MTSTPYFLSRVLLEFLDSADDLLGELSAVAQTPGGYLWCGSDELNTLERLSQVEPCMFANHQRFNLDHYLPLENQKDEVDIEGLAYDQSYLWITGSHSLKRSKPKGKNPQKDIERLMDVKSDANRYLLGRIPVVGGELFKSCSDPVAPHQTLTAACLEKRADGNQLTDALRYDSHLGPFLTIPLPSKENGFDIEGLAVYGDRLFLGLRGPVLGDWSILLEIALEEQGEGMLALKPIGEGGRLYRKHFLNLAGLGIRELQPVGDDLLILAGSTMSLDGPMQIYRLKDVLNHSSDSISDSESGDLKLLFNLPTVVGSDRAEGLSLFPCFGEENALMVVYDSPDLSRRVSPHAIFADVFRLS